MAGSEIKFSQIFTAPFRKHLPFRRVSPLEPAGRHIEAETTEKRDGGFLGEGRRVIRGDHDESLSGIVLFTCRRLKWGF